MKDRMKCEIVQRRVKFAIAVTSFYNFMEF